MRMSVRRSAMKRPHRLDDRAVSPVIATILLVAITVVLAGVLYIMLSGLLIPGQSGPRVLGIALTKSGDGKNWTLTVVSTPQGLTQSEALLTIYAPNGSVMLSKNFLVLVFSTDGAAFIGTGSAVAVGDRLLVDTARYGTRYEVQIADATSVLYSAAFP